jgi:hypothetical protein
MNARALELAASAFSAAFLIAACAAPPAPLTAKSYGSFRAIDPMDMRFFWGDEASMDQDRDGLTTRDEILSQLPNVGGHVTRARLDRWGKIVSVGESRSVSGARYDLTFDWGRYRSDGYEPDAETHVVVHSGVGTRIRAQFTTSSSGIDLTSLEAIGEAADEGDLEGTIELSTIGLSGRGIDESIPSVSSISSDAVYQILDAAQQLRAKLYNREADINFVALAFGQHNPAPALRDEIAGPTGGRVSRPVPLHQESELSSAR